MEIGLLLGKSLTGAVGPMAIILGIVGAALLWIGSYFLESYRRILLGVSGGMLFGLSLAALVGLDSLLGGFFGTVLALFFGLIGGFIVPRFFDLFVIVASAFGGAAIVMTGAHVILPGVGLFDRAGGRLLPVLITLVLATTGIGWQFRNIERWAHPAAGNPGEGPQR